MEVLASDFTVGLRAIIQKEMDMQLNVQASAREFQETMDVLRSKLHGLRKEKIRDLHIRKWIDRLENIMYDADDVLDECHLRNSELRLLSNPPSPASGLASAPVWRNFPLILTYVTRPYQFYYKQFCSNRDISSKLQALNSRLQLLLTQRDKLDLHLLDISHDLPPIADPEAYTTPIVASSSDVVGAKLHKDVGFMVKLLTDPQGSDELSVYAIVGPGGIGKTTMANLIFESLCDEKPGCFDRFIRVTVSRQFDKTDLLKRIIRAAAGRCSCVEGDILQLDDGIKKAIKGKKLLLLLDDVWDAMGLWNLWLGVLFSNCCAKRSRVLITTRNRDAADQMKAVYSHSVQRLTGEDGWELLCRCVGSAPEAEQMKILKNTGLQILGKCYGNPLAIMSMGGMLCLENKARVVWERLLDDDDNIWSNGLLSLPDGIHKDIYCAFDSLSSAELRHCFEFCSLFPDGYEISFSDLIEMWVAEGIVEDDEAALSCFMHLIRRNVLVARPSPEFARTCKLDGLSCSLGRFVMQGSGFVITQTLPLPATPRLPVIDSKNKLRRLSLVIANGNAEKAKTAEFEYKVHDFLKKHPSLRTLLLFNHPLPRAGELLHHLPCIRLLSLRKAAIFKLPESIGSLVHLRFLDLSENDKMKELPESIGKLAYLKALRLQSCKELGQLPKSFLNLKNLMYFDARETKLEGLPEGMGNEMPNLRKIMPLRPHEQGKQLATTKDVEKMNMLRSLDLEISGNVLSGLPKGAEQVRKVGILESKVYLRELVLRWKPEEAAGKNKHDLKNLLSEVSDKLCPPEDLEDLRIIHYYGSSLPSWLTLASRLPNLRSLQLEGCLNLKVISSLGQLPCLEHLLLKKAPKVTSVGKQFLKKTLQGEEESSSSRSFSSFPKLKVLHFEGMAEWEKWEWEKMESGTEEFPSLHTIMICNCPKLKSMPEGLLSRLKMLRQLIIDEAPELRLEGLEGLPSFLEIKRDSQVNQRSS